MWMRAASFGRARLQSRSGAPPSELDIVAALAGQPRHISAAGVTRSGARLMTLENDSPYTNSLTAAPCDRCR